MRIIQNRRRFLTTLSLAGARRSFAARQRWPPRDPSKQPQCAYADPRDLPAPQYVAEELLRAEGFTDIRFVDAPIYSGG